MQDILNEDDESISYKLLSLNPKLVKIDEPIPVENFKKYVVWDLVSEFKILGIVTNKKNHTEYALNAQEESFDQVFDRESSELNEGLKAKLKQKKESNRLTMPFWSTMSVESDFAAYFHNSSFTHNFFICANPSNKQLDAFFRTVQIEKVNLIINLNSPSFYPSIFKEKA